MVCMVELKDNAGVLLGTFETPEKAKETVPQADYWSDKLQTMFGDNYNGWVAADVPVYGQAPHYTIREV